MQHAYFHLTCAVLQTSDARFNNASVEFDLAMLSLTCRLPSCHAQSRSATAIVAIPWQQTAVDCGNVQAAYLAIFGRSGLGLLLKLQWLGRMHCHICLRFLHKRPVVGVLLYHHVVIDFGVFDL